MDKYEAFTKWSDQRGIKRYGITMHTFSGKGLGVVAEKRIEAGSTILFVPISALRTAYTVPKSIYQSLSPTTVHGLLATELCLETSDARRPWRAVLPTMQDFASSMPFAGHKPSHKLSSSAMALLEKQHQKYAVDWSEAHKAFPGIAEDDFMHKWCLVNTRTFYYVKEGTARPKKTDDCMAMVPFADMFNHTRRGGCHVTFDRKGCTILADKAYAIGEELFISYGDHSNDFLLVEYGFVLDDGRWE